MLEMGAVSGRALGFGMLATAFVFGLRHGIDWDHLAAITDLTGSQLSSRRSMVLATCYALGHGLVVFGLGVAAVLFAEELPRGVDAVMERMVGATLLLLGVYVVVSLVRHGRDFRMRSRWMLVITTTRRAVAVVQRRLGRACPQEFVVIEHEHPHRHDVDHGHAHLPSAVGSSAADHRDAAEEVTSSPPPSDSPHRHRHRHVLPLPPDPFAGPGVGGALGIGALHGIGAETPTQVVVFVGAAGASGPVAGLCMLASFVVGLLVSNTAVATVTTFGQLSSARRFPVYAGVSIVTAAFSLAMGALFVLGQGDALPTIFG
jgi:high-affinity nickel-transport protein